jgi:uncharacterized protein (DUF608 family)
MSLPPSESTFDSAFASPQGAFSGDRLYADDRLYAGDHLLQIAMPLGGIGAGCICLNGQGGLQDFSIRNAPATSALADGHQMADSAFATLSFPALGLTRLVEGPLPVQRIYDQGLKGQGFRGGGHEGLPRFRNVTFRGEYPFGEVQLSDPALPVQVSVMGFNPFVPLDDVASSLPCAILEYTLTNPGAAPVDYEFAYHLSHLAPGANGDFSKTRSAVVEDYGAYLYNVEDPQAEAFGSCALGLLSGAPLIKAAWFRGGWFDALSALWRELSTNTFTPHPGDDAPLSGRSGASLLVKGRLAAGQSVTYPVVIAWYFPNVSQSFGEAQPACNCSGGECCAEGGTCDCANPPAAGPRWKPFYTTRWTDARDVLRYVREQYPSLRARTRAFHDALFQSSLPAAVLDAVSANLAILKSPTVLRQSNGNVWAWEGCFCSTGCCHGSCTHVWNYAQALPHLFPALERTLREQELLRSIDERGHVSFRSALPDGPAPHDFHAASDGQLGGILKLYREWQISGDRAWLQQLYPAAKHSLDFCIANWDPEHTGLLREPHHNTYDIEFWGPDGMCSAFYLGALSAMALLAVDAGYPEDADAYAQLAQKGAQAMEDQLFNGEYYQQKVQLHGLRASPTPAALIQLRKTNPAEHELLLREGPKYQYGSGCLSDSVFGAWLAQLCGVATPQNRASIRSTLQSIFKYNFRASLWEHANVQRPGYAMGDEPGLLLCTWPRGGKPTLPFVYSDEVWTGIEYQVAGHCIAEGLVEEGLAIVRAARSRYDGRVRNPWNEYECGNYYARAMASYGLLIACSGFRYAAPTRTLYLAPRLSAEPRLPADPFRCFFSTASGWGALTLHGDAVTVEVIEGQLTVETLVLNGETRTLPAPVTAEPGKPVVL